MMSIRPARTDEQKMLESIQRRASLSNPGDRDALLANPDAIALPLEQIVEGCVSVQSARAPALALPLSFCGPTVVRSWTPCDSG